MIESQRIVAQIFFVVRIRIKNVVHFETCETKGCSELDFFFSYYILFCYLFFMGVLFFYFYGFIFFRFFVLFFKFKWLRKECRVAVLGVQKGKVLPNGQRSDFLPPPPRPPRQNIQPINDLEKISSPGIR